MTLNDVISSFGSTIEHLREQRTGSLLDLDRYLSQIWMAETGAVQELVGNYRCAVDLELRRRVATGSAIVVETDHE